MKIGKNNKLLQKILMVMLTTLILFNFIMPTVVKATDDEYDGEVSSLAGPIQSLIVLLGDAGMSLMQYVFVGNWDITERVTEEGSIPEWAENLFAFILPSVGTILDYLGEYEYLDIPNFQISPEAIFQGEIPAFDINFFNPMVDDEGKTGEAVETIIFEGNTYESADQKLIEYGWKKNENTNVVTEMWEHENRKNRNRHRWI